MPIGAPWLIVPLKWKDKNDEPLTIAYLKKLFTGDGVGTMNMVDFFFDMSHGVVATSGTKVLDWITLSRPFSDYAFNTTPAPEGKINRAGLLELGRAAATNAGHPPSNYAGVVFCMNAPTDLFGGPSGVVCDKTNMSPSLLGQEMAHGFGLQHSRKAGSEADYNDPWDVMSTVDSTYMTPGGTYGTFGPGLNAANMRSKGWLNRSRVWKSPPITDSWSREIEIVPLHHRDTPGYLAVEIGELIVELRDRSRWDAMIPRAAVFVHSFDDGHSYLEPARNGDEALGPGDVWEWGRPNVTALPYTRVEIVDIRFPGPVAVLKMKNRAASFSLPPLKIPVGEGTGLGAGSVTVGGHSLTLPAGHAMLPVLAQVVAFEAAAGLPDETARLAAQNAALREITRRVEVERDARREPELDSVALPDGVTDMAGLADYLRRLEDDATPPG